MSEASPIILKYSNNMITLRLSDTADFKEIATAVCHKFADNRKFFGANEFVLCIEDRRLSSEEEKAIIDAIELNSDVHIRFVKIDDKLKEINIEEEVECLKQQDLLKAAVVIKGSIAKGKNLSFDTGIIIMGDVKEGAIVKARGNVIVFGDIAGDVTAGYPDTKNAFIACTSFSASRATIGNLSDSVELDPKWSRRKTTEDCINLGITIFDRHLICEPLKTGILKQL